MKITNISKVDEAIDIVGDNNPKDKVIIHPKETITVDVSNEIFSKVLQNRNLKVTK